MPEATDFVVPGLFRLRGLDEDDINLVLPAHLMADLPVARSVVNEVILETNRLTKQGRDGGYFEALQAAFWEKGIQVLAQIPALGTRPWDDDCTDELGDLTGDSGDLATVVISNICEVFESGDDDQMLCEIDGDETHASYAIDADAVGRLRVSSMDVTYPRSERYGVPECCTDRGGRQYLRDLGISVSATLEVNACDSRDDTPMRISLTCEVPRALLNPVSTERESAPGAPAP